MTTVIGVIVLPSPSGVTCAPASPARQRPALATIGLIAVGAAYPLVLGLLWPRVLEQAPALLEGEESLATDPLPIGG